MLSFGNIGSASNRAPLSFGTPVSATYDDAILRRARASGATTYRPPASNQRQAAPSPTLSFPGVASVPPVTSSNAPLSYGTRPVSSGGFISSATDFLRDFSFGTPAPSPIYDDAIMRSARASGATTYNPNSPASLANTPQSTVGNVDGSASWLDRLRTAGDAVQGLMGSLGDASGEAVQQVAYRDEPRGPNWLVVGGIVALAGAAYYAATR